MTRPPKEKHVKLVPKVTYFRPKGVYLADLEEITLSLTELETLRLVHVEGFSQTKAATHLGVHQSTLQRILTKAEQKTARALLFGYALRIGNV